MDNLGKEKRSSYCKAKKLENVFDDFFKDIETRIPIFNSLNVNYKFEGNILEIGAGSSWLSALISKIPEVNQVYALDISQELLEKIGKRTFARLEGHNDKINFVISDFQKMPFPDGQFDMVVCDAALHHAQNIEALLQEINRVLKNDGFFLGIREPIKSVLHQLEIIDFGKKEKEQGSTEMIYSKEEWKKHFKNAGLELEIIEDFSQENMKTNFLKIYPLRLFNGILFSRYYFFAKKVRTD